MAGLLKNRFLFLLTEKERKEGKLIKPAELARAIGVSRPTIYSWLENSVTKYESPIVVAICEYFGCDLCDLLYIETVEDEAEESAQE